MTTPSNPIVARTFVHASYVDNKKYGTDAVIVSEIVDRADGTSSPELRIIKDPKVPFWITQQQHRNHTNKKEFEHVSKLDMFSVPYRTKDLEMYARLFGKRPNFMGRNQRKELYESPFLYGANISIEALVAMRYKDELAKAGRTPTPFTSGFLDIEQSLVKATFKEIPIITFTAGNRVFVGVRRSFMVEQRGSEFVKITLDDIKRDVATYLDPMVAELFATHKGLKKVRDQVPFQYEYYVGETAADIICWIWDRIHETKVSFVGVWNINFDLPEIIKALEDAGIDPVDVFTHPKFRGTNYAKAEYHIDKRDVAHFTQKWNILSAASHAMFTDSMSLYSYTRAIKGRESSYKLDDILNNFGLGGKLHFNDLPDMSNLQQDEWHRVMLVKHFSKYVVYGMWDTMALQVLEWHNRDLTAMRALVDVTPVRNYPNQTIQITNTFYEEYRPQGWILGTGTNVETEVDDDLLTEGGAVLEPQNVNGKGMHLFFDMPHVESRAYAMSVDVDFAGLYPSITYMMNIAKQTKQGTIVKVYGAGVSSMYAPDEAVEIMCSYLISPHANGVELGTEFFGLPGYAEMQALFEAR